MRVLLIIDETNFYQPNFVADLVKYEKFNFIGCVLVTKMPDKSNLELYFIKNFNFLRPSEILKLCFKKVKYMVFNFFKTKHPKHFYSVKSVLRYYNIPYFKVEYDINQPIYINKIKALAPDIILSSNSLYFRKEIIEIPKFCINRHSSLLPAYGGLLPVFQALKNGENYIGVSVHLMQKKIDQGLVIAQKKINVTEKDTVDSLYKKCFEISAEVCINAINNLYNQSHTKNNDLGSEIAPSYFGFPSKQDWIFFRKKTKRFI